MLLNSTAVRCTRAAVIWSCYNGYHECALLLESFIVLGRNCWEWLVCIRVHYALQLPLLALKPP